jgi:23S rRNA (cytidine1920-2'-O)/16S rRNA (cytidine1409-2'-O)-methyltransferase
MMSRSKYNRPKDCPYVGKGGLKLEFALTHFELNVENLTAVDLGCNCGFTDCLLQHGTTKVYAVDTAYGQLEWKLRIDPRVVVCERTNALFWTAPEQTDLVVSDLGWTKQEKSLPLIQSILKPGGLGLSLVKPQYEYQHDLKKGVLPEELIPEVIKAVRENCPEGLEVLGDACSPVKGNGGNTEYWLLVRKRE